MLRKSLVLLVLLAGLALTACGGGPATPTPTATLTGEQAQTAAAQTVVAQLTQTAAAQPSPTFTDTPSPTVSPTLATATVGATKTSTVAFGGGSSCDLVGFVSDVTIPDGTVMSPGQTFTKTWKLRNDGTCTWNSDYDLVFYSGDQMSGPASQQLTTSTVAPGATIDVSVQLTAPTVAGTYRGNWMLRNAAGTTFGTPEPFWVEIKVGGASSTPGTGTPGTGVDLVATNIVFYIGGNEYPNPPAGQQVQVRVTIKNIGTSATTTPFTVIWYADADDPNSFTCSGTVNGLGAGETFTLGTDASCKYTYPNTDPVTTKVVVDATNKVAESDEENTFTKVINPV